ncbi:tetratricopeptide repeat protein [Deltaproteobacteria bacterium OttesenSCG-928-K17]|nr:tetratricopeptide repeat protein [Deltaproteobacteria bacterium OttesenSCG-928-K17]
MADDKLFPDFGDSDDKGKPGGSNLKDPAAGAEVYVESAADGGGIDLGGLGGLLEDGGKEAVRAPGENVKKMPAPKAAEAKAPAGDDGLASDFPAEALNPQTAAPLLAGPAGGLGSGAAQPAFIVVLNGFWAYVKKIFSAIPPVDDIFDSILRACGLQRQPPSILRRAASLAYQGRLPEAVRYFREYQSLRPISVQGYDGLGRVYFRMGLTEDANREFVIADCMERILHNRDDIDAAAALAEAFLERKQAKIAVSLIEPVLIAHFYSRGNSALLKAMGRVYTEMRATKKMYQVYEAGLDQHPGEYEFHIGKGQAEIRLGNVAEGESLVRWGRLMKKVKENPRDANTRMAMGEIYIKEGKTVEGLRQLREAALIQPTNSGVRWRLFNLYNKRGAFDDAHRYLREIVDLDPKNEDLQMRLADFFRKHGHNDEAIDIYQKLIDEHPRDPKPHAVLGELLSDLGRFDEGQRHKDLGVTLEGGLKANPDHRDTVRFMKYLFAAGQTDEAMQWLERGLNKWPYHGELVLTRVRLLYNEYRYKDAVALLKRLITVKPDMAEPHIWVAMCYQKLGDNMAALAEAQLATRLAPKSYTAHKVLGDILKDQKKLSQATAAYEAADMIRQNSRA